ncbi:hypothetical protein BG000_011692 [Podila horticola]|nr:hypothetical protein BG000_011692 [Podila horticola]
MGYRTEFFATHLAMNPGLLSLTLLNYPGHQEQCTYYYTLLVRPVALEALESLRMLIVDVNDLKIDHEIACMVRASPMLRELNISLRETRTLERVEKTLEIWHGRIGSLQLTLLERGVDGRGRSVCQAIVRGGLDRYLGGASVGLQGSNALRANSQEWRKGAPANIEFMQWSSDHVSAPLADTTAVLLDMGTEYNPSVLTSLVLDISNLSQDGWASVQNILQRSMLGNLHIVCTTFDLSLNDFVRQVLLSVQWSALQSLVVSGEAVNKWIQLLATISNDKATMITPGLQLQCFRVQGSGKQLVRLSHSSVLFVHQLVYLNPAIELILENACLQDDRDTDLLR